MEQQQPQRIAFGMLDAEPKIKEEYRILASCRPLTWLAKATASPASSGDPVNEVDTLRAPRGGMLHQSESGLRAANLSHLLRHRILNTDYRTPSQGTASWLAWIVRASAATAARRFYPQMAQMRSVCNA
ncbi:MAG: hypothetical protein NTV22_05065 [bacterium]|nr:hypothetical protein [bacterium]